MDTYSITATTNPNAEEEYSGPRFLTHKGVKYKVRCVVFSCDVTGSSVRIWVPFSPPGGEFGHKTVWVYHALFYDKLTKAQHRRFFPRKDFRKIWGKDFRFPKSY